MGTEQHPMALRSIFHIGGKDKKSRFCTVEHQHMLLKTEDAAKKLSPK